MVHRVVSDLMSFVDHPLNALRIVSDIASDHEKSHLNIPGCEIIHQFHGMASRSVVEGKRDHVDIFLGNDIDRDLVSAARLVRNRHNTAADRESEKRSVLGRCGDRPVRGQKSQTKKIGIGHKGIHRECLTLIDGDLIIFHSISPCFFGIEKARAYKQCCCSEHHIKQF